MRTSRDYEGVQISITTGTEGPRQDPYAFSRYSFTIKSAIGDVEVTLHLGLGEYLEVNDKKICTEYEEIKEQFKTITGFDLDPFLDVVDAPETYICKKCGCTEVDYVSGFPGETVILCSNCKEMLGQEMDMEAIR